MKEFKEKDFLSLISRILRAGMVLFILFSFISYIVKPFNYHLHKNILDAAVFILIITPLLRIVMLVYGFYRLNERRYSFYAFIIFVLLLVGVIKKV